MMELKFHQLMQLPEPLEFFKPLGLSKNSWTPKPLKRFKRLKRIKRIKRLKRIKRKR